MQATVKDLGCPEPRLPLPARPPAGRLLPRVGAEVRAAAGAGQGRGGGLGGGVEKQPRGGGRAKAREAGKEEKNSRPNKNAQFSC